MLIPFLLPFLSYFRLLLLLFPFLLLIIHNLDNVDMNVHVNMENTKSMTGFPFSWFVKNAFKLVFINSLIFHLSDIIVW